MIQEKRNRYDREFKLKAVHLSYKKGSIILTEKELQLKPAQLTRWRKDYQNYGNKCFPGYGYSKLNAEKKKITELERKIRQTEMRFEILKNGQESVHKGLPSILDFISSNKNKWPVSVMCEVLHIKVSSYYKWKKQRITITQKKKNALLEKITTVFIANGQLYGSKRIWATLNKSGTSIGLSTVEKYMKELGLKAGIYKNGLP